jgi:hypothetical protein
MVLCGITEMQEIEAPSSRRSCIALLLHAPPPAGKQPRSPPPRGGLLADPMTMGGEEGAAVRVPR